LKRFLKELVGLLQDLSSPRSVDVLNVAHRGQAGQAVLLVKNRGRDDEIADIDMSIDAWNSNVQSIVPYVGRATKIYDLTKVNDIHPIGWGLGGRHELDSVLPSLRTELPLRTGRLSRCRLFVLFDFDDFGNEYSMPCLIRIGFCSGRVASRRCRSSYVKFYQ